MSTLGLGATLKCGSYVVNEIMTKSDNTVKIKDDSVAVKNYISNTVYENDVFLDNNDELRSKSTGELEYEFCGKTWKCTCTAPPSYNESSDSFPMVLFFPGLQAISDVDFVSKEPIYDILNGDEASPISITSKRGYINKNNLVSQEVINKYKEFIWVGVNTQPEVFDTDLYAGAIGNPKMLGFVQSLIDQVLPRLKINKDKMFLAGVSIGGQIATLNMPSRVFDDFKKIVLFSSGPRNSELPVIDFPEYMFFKHDDGTAFRFSGLGNWFIQALSEKPFQPLRIVTANDDKYFFLQHSYDFQQFLSENNSNCKVIDIGPGGHGGGWQKGIDQLLNLQYEDGKSAMTFLDWFLLD